MATIPTFPSIDFSKLDLSRLSPQNLPSLSDLQAQLGDLPGVDADKLVAALRDAAYVTIGFGVLAFQQAQVRRREIVQSLSTRFGSSKGQIEELLSSMEAQIKGLDQRFDAIETTIDAAVVKLEGRLPDQASALLGQAHELAKSARKQARGLLSSVA